MKRITYWTLSTVSAVVLLFGFDASRTHPDSTTSAQSFSSGPATTTGGTTPTPSSAPSAKPSSSTTKKSGSAQKSTSPSSAPSSAAPTSTTVTGSVANTVWGPVQVQLRVTSGTISKIGILQYPNGNGRDVEIANYAFPVLIQETIKSQSANIDMVSGATYTSTGYIQSLQSALDQANL